tara:strand:- start:427 stop:1416 length:990 start_codon:yes stop_codon:yes gene_type:complete
MSTFLDNSGDIILDAVLTKIGRKKLSQGNFKIVKYAMGDDEINYALYDKNNVSGSAYYDLEILQTPILQGCTSDTAELRFKLVTNTNNNLLYMPVLKQNTKISTETVFLHNGVLLVAVNEQTKEKLNTAIGKDSCVESMSTTGRMLCIESGLDTTSLIANAANRSLLTSQNMMDNRYRVEVDTRFISNVFGPRGGKFTNTYNSSTTTFSSLQNVQAGSNVSGMANYASFSVGSVANTVYYYATSTKADTTLSAIAGPRGTITKINFGVVPGLRARSSASRSPLWSTHGKINDTLAGLTIDRLDTIVYIVGHSSGASLQVPLRLVRYVSG